MTFEEALNEIPPGWTFSHLMAIEPSGYQCNLLSYGERACTIATGDTPHKALLAAILKSCDGANHLPLYVPDDHASPDDIVLRNSIDIAKLFFTPREKMRRV